jgi:2-haloacid dehalogenase
MADPMRALVFDAYGTLLDIHSVVTEAERLFPGHGTAFSELWRAKQLRYTWLRSLMGRYQDFARITEHALEQTCATLELPCDDAVRHALMQAYRELQPFPDAVPALTALRLPKAILSNGCPSMLGPAVRHAGLDGLLDAVLSVDAVKAYKPDPRVYQLAGDHFGGARDEIGFVTSNDWDAAGAAAFGFRVFWINRTGAIPDQLGTMPEAVLGALTELPAYLGGH